MAAFAQGIPRLAVLVAAAAIFLIIPPGALGRGPNLCLWRHLFHIAACPACGSLRALAAFFHGDFSRAWRFNHNVAVTGPLLVALLGEDALELLRKARPSRSSRSRREIESAHATKLTPP